MPLHSKQEQKKIYTKWTKDWSQILNRTSRECKVDTFSQVQATKENEAAELERQLHLNDAKKN
jgi:hypothetical protein